jgi:hypothetical protein
LRVTRDQRGYETTFLVHSPRPGERPRVLYWYRTAPGVRVGRPALDEDAIRAIEEQHPEIEFDWPHLLEEATSAPTEIERRPERPRRKPQRPRDELEAEVPAPVAAPVAPPPAPAPPPQPPPQPPVARPVLSQEPSRNPLLDQLVGREIATRLRARYAEVTARISEAAEGDRRMAWQQRADALDPDRWSSAEQILEGIRHAERRFDELRRELP